MMTCRDVSTTVATGQVSRQSLAARLQIWMHLVICPPCRRFWQQMRAIDRGVSSWLRTVEAETPADLAQRAAVRMAAGSAEPPARTGASAPGTSDPL